jgi:hypothetical protein
VAFCALLDAMQGGLPSGDRVRFALKSGGTVVILRHCVDMGCELFQARDRAGRMDVREIPMKSTNFFMQSRRP